MVTARERLERRLELRRRMWELARFGETPPAVSIELAELLVDLYAALLDRDAELDVGEGRQ